jgi:Flp pilus assembly protein TadD
VLILLLGLGCGDELSPRPVTSVPVQAPAAPVSLARARQALREERFEAALQAFDALVAADPSLEMRIQRAHALRIAGRADAARSAYTALTRDHPGAVLPHLALGELARTEERWADALPHLDRAIALAPDSPVPWEHRAVCLWALDQREAALQALDEAEARGSDQVGVLRPGMR